MALDRLTKVTGPGISSDHNWVGNNATFTGVTTAGSSFNVGISTFHSTLAEVHNIKSTGIITATGGSFSGNVTAVDGTFSGNVSIAGTLTYEDVTNIDSVGIITAPAVDVDDFLDVGSNIKLGNAGVITATSFVGSGAALTGIDATAIKDSGGNVKIQAQASGAIHSGVSTFQDIDVDGHTNLDNVSIAGITTFADNAKAIFGTGGDMQIFHDGTNSRIENDVTNLFLQSQLINLANHDGTEVMINANANGAVNLYFDNSKKLETTGYGINITAHSDIRFTNGNWTGDIINGKIQLHNNILYLCSGTEGFTFREGSTDRWRIDPNGHFLPAADSTYDIGTSGVRVRNFYADTLYGDGSNLTGINADLVNDSSPQLGGNLDVNTKNIVFGDSGSSSDDRLTFGAGTDLSIYHDGSHSYIHDSGTGNLRIRGDDVEITDNASNNNMARFIEGGAVELYHNNGKKFETTSYGAAVTGGINFSGDSLVQDNVSIFFGASNDLGIKHDGTNSYLQNVTGVLYVNNTGGTATNLILKAASNIELQPASGETGVKAIANGAVEIYHNNVKQLETDSGGVIVTDNDSTSYVNLTTTSGNAGYLYASGSTDLGLLDGNGSWMLRGIKDGALELYHDANKKLETSSSGVTVTGAVTATSFSGDGSSLTGISAFVTGMIIIWSGAANAIPSGWVLCNGSNSTPDLRGRFIVGYHDGNGDYDVNDTGGAETVTLSTSQIPSHDHAFSGSGSSSHSHSFTVNNEYSQLFHPKQSMIARGENKSGTESYGTSSATVSLSISGTTNTAGSGGSHENRPPYYALCYIMKT